MSSGLRILTLSLYYPPHHYGGYEVSCADVMARLAARGHAVEVLTSQQRRAGVVDPPAERAAGVRRELQPYVVDGELWAPNVARRWAVERHNIGALRAAIAEHRPDVVSVWQLGGLSLGLASHVAALGVPAVFVVCDDWLAYGAQLDAWSRLWNAHPHLARAGRALLRVPTALPADRWPGDYCFISATTRERATRYSRWAFVDAPVVYSGIDTSFFAPAARDDTTWGGRLLYVGRLDPRKGLDTAVQALVDLPDHTLEVQGVGTDAERAHVAALAQELGVRGRVTVEDMPRSALPSRYAAADAVVFPSEWEEPFGLVPLEAMSVGTPVVATGVGGSGEFLVDGFNCIRFGAGRADELAGAVARLAGDAPRRRSIVAGGAATARWFAVDNLVDVLEGWHLVAAGREGTRPPSRCFSVEQVQAGERGAGDG